MIVLLLLEKVKLKVVSKYIEERASSDNVPAARYSPVREPAVELTVRNFAAEESEVRSSAKYT